MTAEEVVVKYKEKAIRSKIPKQWLGKTVGEIEKAQSSGDKSAQTAAKLLGRNEYNKNKKKK